MIILPENLATQVPPELFTLIGSFFKALVTFRNVGDSIDILQVLHNRARIDLLRGNFASAKKLLVEALESSWRLNTCNELAAIYLLLSLLHLCQGESAVQPQSVIAH